MSLSERFYLEFAEATKGKSYEMMKKAKYDALTEFLKHPRKVKASELEKRNWKGRYILFF